MVFRYVLEWFGVVMLFGFIMILCNSNYTYRRIENDKTTESICEKIR